jgi:hypothetical protein
VFVAVSVCLAAEVHAGASIRISGAQQVVAEEEVEEETETFWRLYFTRNFRF